MNKLIEDVSSSIQDIINNVIAGGVEEKRIRAIEELLGTVISVLAEDAGETVINVNLENVGDGVHDIGHDHEMIVENGTVRLQRKQ